MLPWPGMPCEKRTEQEAPALLGAALLCAPQRQRVAFQSAWNVCFTACSESQTSGASSAWKCGVCGGDAAVPVQLRRKQFATLLHLLEMLQEAVSEGPGTGGVAT